MFSRNSAPGDADTRNNAAVFADLPDLHTPRLLLRKMRLSDAEDMFTYARTPDVSRFLVWSPHRSVEESRGFLAYVADRYAAGLMEDWGIEHRPSGRFIGTAGYFFWDEPHRRAEIHYCLSKEFWGQGLMPEAVAAIVSFGFERMGLHRVEAKCFPDNTGSEKVLRKVGMQYEGLMREGLYAKGVFHDLKTFAILATDPRPHPAAPVTTGKGIQ